MNPCGPIRECCKALLHELPRNPDLPQLGPHPQRSLATRRVKADEIIHVATIVQQVLGNQPLDHLGEHTGIVALGLQLAAQLVCGVIAPREGI